MADKDWVTIKIPQQLAQQIDQAIKHKTVNSHTRAELTREALTAYLTTQQPPKVRLQAAEPYPPPQSGVR